MFSRRLADDRDAFLASVFAPRDTGPDYRGIDRALPWADALAVVGDPQAEPGPECAAARRASGNALHKTAADYTALCDRLAHRARTDPAIVERIAEEARLERERAATVEKTPTPTPRRKPRRKTKADARAVAIAEAKAMHEDGVPVAQIMDTFNVSRATVFRWLKAA
ncbi:MAG: helix-turn-helix domain-containing protein [Gemmatimonadetes bacterium]|nr:helix-turn-helix domain-containing protein [Gemmatimonadota bacterium]